LNSSAIKLKLRNAERLREAAEARATADQQRAIEESVMQSNRSNTQGDSAGFLLHSAFCSCSLSALPFLRFGSRKQLVHVRW
jgi:hypothetical protein